MNRKKGKENKTKSERLVNYKDLERNVLNEIASEFHDSRKNSKDNQNKDKR